MRQSCTAWRGSGWSGTSIGPVTFSWQAAAPGNTAASRSSLCIRWKGGGTLRPPRKRSTTRLRFRFHRQRLWKIGWSRMACCSVARIEPEVRKRGTSASGKLWWGPREMTMASSLALAWSSKLNPAQNFLRSAYPIARLTRPP